MKLLVDSASQKTPVHGQHVTGDEAGAFRSEKDRRANKLMQLSKAFHGRAQQKFFPTLCAIEQLRVKVGAKYSRSNGIDADSTAGPFNG